MFNRLKKLYEQKRLTKEMLKTAVNKNWISKEEYKTITGDEL